MDQIKIGRFIALLRRQAGLTQEALGEKIGVTNKTVSRWENGNYIPDIEMLQLLAEEFGVSINELLSGEFIADKDFRKKADANVIAVSMGSAFSLAEKKNYFKRKWRREHMALFVISGMVPIAVVVLSILSGKPWLSCLAPPAALAEYAFLNNKMMIYVENSLYG